MPYGIPGSAILPPPISSAPLAPMNPQRNIVRIGEQCFWSTQAYADTTALADRNDRIFTTPRGQVGQGFGASLTISETNLKEGGRIPSQYAFDVEGISCQPFYTDNYVMTRVDLQNIQNYGVLAWDFTQTVIEVAPINLIGAGGGTFGTTADTAGRVGGQGGSIAALNNGAGQLWVYRRHPVMLPSNSTFAMLLQYGSGATAVDGGAGNSTLAVRVGLLGRFQTAIATG